MGYDEKQTRARLEGREPYQALPDPQEFLTPFIPEPSVSLEIHPLLREFFAKQLQKTANTAWCEGQRRLFEHLVNSVPYWPEGIKGLEPLYQAVAHGCQAEMEEKAFAVYRNRILRGTEPWGFYSQKKLGAVGANLGAASCFFIKKWREVRPRLDSKEEAWLLAESGFCLRALGRLDDAVQPFREGLKIALAPKEADWFNAARSSGNLSETELALGQVLEAVAEGQRSVNYAESSKNARWQVIGRTPYADALHQAGKVAEALFWFSEAEKLHAEQHRNRCLDGFQGFRYCDLLLADVERNAWRLTLVKKYGLDFQKQPPNWQTATPDNSTLKTVCDEVAKRSEQILAWAPQEKVGHLAHGLNHLTFARTALYVALLNGTTVGAHLSFRSAVDSLVQEAHHLPRALLTRAWLRWLNGEQEGCDVDLKEAWENAKPGPMKLHMADILLTRARLFSDRAALAEARKLIEYCGYWRRKEELKDAETALAWPW